MPALICAVDGTVRANINAVGPIENPDDLHPALAEAVRVIKDKKQLALVDVVTQAS